MSRPVTVVASGADALARAVRSESSEWIWLLAPGAQPRDDALACLLRAAEATPEAPPKLLAGTVCDAGGGVIVRELPAADIHSPEIIDAVSRHTLPLRSTTLANCLVRRDCFVRHGLPDTRRYGPYAGAQWSAVVLREETGYVVPDCIVTLTGSRGRRDALTSIPSLARMLRTGAWTRGDAVANVRWCLADLLTPAGGGAAR